MREILIIGPLVFLAGFIDSIAGGGGLISLPAYTMAGIPMHQALGSNKFSSSFGAIMATFEYVRKDRYMRKLAIVSALTALIGSFIGARLTLLVEEIYLKKILIGVLPLMAIFLLTRKRQIDVKTLNVSLSLGILIAFVIGMYDGFLGPGTGSLLIFCYVTFMHIDYTRASGTAKVVNLASNLAAAAVFLFSGNILFHIAIPAAVCSIAGSFLGSRLAIKNGAKVIRPVLIGVLGLLMIKLVLDVL
ncbi:MAG: TSUP family transporter [Erysipelotrichaceae bacterium]